MKKQSQKQYFNTDTDPYREARLYDSNPRGIRRNPRGIRRGKSQRLTVVVLILCVLTLAAFLYLLVKQNFDFGARVHINNENSRGLPGEQEARANLAEEAVNKNDGGNNIYPSENENERDPDSLSESHSLQNGAEALHDERPDDRADSDRADENRIDSDISDEQGREDFRQRYTFDRQIDVNGVRYRERKNLTTVLLMGIDQDSDTLDSQKTEPGSQKTELDSQKKEDEELIDFRNGGQADFLRLIVIDHDRKTVAQLAIDRDSITPITIIGVLGQRAGERKAQIALAHAFGDGKEQSGELAVEAVSKLILGQPIDYYAALNLNGISTLNDFVGGVDVTIPEDLTELDPTWVAGAKVHLEGDKAEAFVRSRMGVSDGTNESRMKRQEIYIQQLIPLLKAKVMSNEGQMKAFLKILEPYFSTNAREGRVINDSLKSRDYDVLPQQNLEGKHTLAKTGYIEYHVDEVQLRDKVVELFYEALN